ALDGIVLAMAGSDHAGGIDLIIVGQDAYDGRGTREAEVPVVLVSSVDRYRVGVAFDVDRDVGIGIEDGGQLAEGFLAFGVDDGATAGEQQIFRQAHIYFTVLDRDGQLIRFKAFQGIRHFLPDLLDG